MRGGGVRNKFVLLLFHVHFNLVQRGTGYCEPVNKSVTALSQDSSEFLPHFSGNVRVENGGRVGVDWVVRDIKTLNLRFGNNILSLFIKL